MDEGSAIDALLVGLVGAGVVASTVIHSLLSATRFLQIDPTSLGSAVVPGLLLTLAAVSGKLLGTYPPARWAIGSPGATLLAISMVPRAEIAMVVMDQGRSYLGDSGWLYSAMVIVVGLTSITAPLALTPLLARWPQR